MTVRQGSALALAALAFSACAYFNGLYNANRLAGDARNAEEDGRTGEARSLWQQAAVKAESVAVRYPDSKYHDDALLLMGRSLSEIGECERAVPPLRRAVDSSRDPEVSRRARLVLGRCLVSMGRPNSAVAVLQELAPGDDALARDARIWRGRAHLARGRYDLAIGDLHDGSGPQVAFDLALAYLALDSIAPALRVLEPQLGAGAPYHEGRWTVVLDSMSRREPQTTARFVDELVRRADVTAGERARLLLADARRLNALGLRESAERRLVAAGQAAPDSSAGRAALAERALLELRRADHPGRLALLAEPMEDAVRTGVPLTWPARRYVELLQATTVVLSDPVHDHDDLRLFRLAELMRDSVGARSLARSLFRELQARYPDSPLAPKALLAEAQLGDAGGDAALLLLRERYPHSPYALALIGDDGPRFRAVEDSLRVLLTTVLLTGAGDSLARRRQ
jgi:tetratricopeptide (TPR) repeat protein